ncbi:MAG: GAF domain-containing protein [Candidatus Solibacter usitatus]|nr:GAF domain-containing protein [Candidatus Solibacter usitatus]
MLSERSFRKWFWCGTTFYVMVLLQGLYYIPARLTRERVLGFTGSIQNGRFVFESSDSPQIQQGDQLLAVNGDSRFGGTFHPATRLADVPPGESYSMQVRRGGQVFDVTLTVRERRDYQWVPQAVLNLMFSLSLFSISTVSAWRRPDLVTVRWAWLTGVLHSASGIFGFISITEQMGWADPWYVRLPMIAPYCAPFAAFRFLEIFPSPLPETRPWRKLRWAVYATMLVGGFGRVPFLVLSSLRGELRYSMGPALWAESLNEMIPRPSLVLVSFALIAVLVRSWLARGAAERKRLQVPVGIIIVARTTAVAAGCLFWAGYLTQAQRLTMAALPLPFVPIALFYAFQWHNVMGVQIVLRRTVRYVLARRFLNVLLFLPLLGVAVRAVIYPSTPVRDLANPRWAFVLMGTIALSGLLYRQRMLDRLDRKFFRQSWDTEQMLRQLLMETRRSLPFGELLGMVGARLEEAFHPRALNLLFRPRRGVPLASEEGVLAEDWHLVQQLRRGKIMEWPGRGESSFPAAEAQWLQSCEAALLVPVISEENVLSGILVLGEKKSELPYTEEDRHLLEVLAGQLALAHQNDLLATERSEAVVEERNRIARELHDTLAQGFAGINLHLESGKRLIESDADQARIHVEQAGALARTSLAEVRRSVHDLRTPESELLTVLQTLAAQFAGIFPIEIDAKTHGALYGTARVPPNVTQTLFRIAQECITNSIKHSGATRAGIRVNLWPDRVELEVSDQGRGFTSSAADRIGWGLAGMRERARQIEADLQILSEPGTGTTVRVAVRFESSAV